MKAQKLYVEGAPSSAPFLEILVADSFFKRLAGLMFRKEFPIGSGILLFPCNSVHMCFMRFAIDVVYLDKDYNIIKIVKDLRPWVGFSMCKNAYATLEMTTGGAEYYGFVTGKKLIIRD